jgi:hypothetical protein
MTRLTRVSGSALALFLGVTFGSSVCADCASGACSADIDLASAGIEVGVSLALADTSAPATLTGSANLSFACDGVGEKLMLADMVLYASDKSTRIATTDLQFQGGSVNDLPCSGLSANETTTDLSASSLPHSLFSSRCGQQLWLTGNIERVGCAGDATFPLGVHVTVNCN